jgi:hypothetical protein
MHECPKYEKYLIQNCFYFIYKMVIVYENLLTIYLYDVESSRMRCMQNPIFNDNSCKNVHITQCEIT